MTEFDLTEWLEYAKKVAKSFERSFPGIEWEDIYQEMAVLLVSKGEEIAAVATKESYIKKALQNVSHNYCMKERDAAFFYSDHYDYRPDYVRILLGEFYAGDAKNLFVEDGAKTVRGDDNLAMYGDISRALDSLPESQQKVLESKYADGVDPQTATGRKALSRVLARLTKTLNENKVKAERDYNGPALRGKVAMA